MEEHFVWMTTRQIKPGTLADFERAWRPDTHPEGMLRQRRGSGASRHNGQAHGRRPVTDVLRRATARRSVQAWH